MSLEDINLGVIINGNPNYTQFEFTPFTIPVIVAFIPLTYIISTFVIIARIINVFIRNAFRKHDQIVNLRVFLVIILSQLSCVGFFITDLLIIRIPATGIITSWCQRSSPNHFLGVIFFFNLYFNYIVMMYPPLLSLVRSIPVYFPTSFNRVNERILKFSLPFIHILPLLCTFFMIPALGVCRQHEAPFSFGAAYIHFVGSWHNIANAPFQLVSCLFWLFICLLINLVFFRKLKLISHNSLRRNQSARYRKAEVSLTLTTSSMLLAYLTNIVFLCLFITDIRLAVYFVSFRPFGNDLETCVVPWVFYLTHPAFRRDEKGLPRTESTII